MNNFLQTNRSPLNNSKCKQLYSFPKTDRFLNHRQPSNAPFYHGHLSALGPRSTTFGYGHKMTFENKAPNPPPDHYPKRGYFEQEIQRRKGFSFSHQSKRNLINQRETVKIPGPGKYCYKGDRGSFKNLSFSFGERLEDPLQRHSNPLGPGQYKTVEETSQVGKYLLANHPSSGCGKIGKSRRFNQAETFAPGPGKYEDTKVTGFNSSGSYFNSNYRSFKANRFAGSPRKHIAEPTIAPGPGTYQSFSDFASYSYK